MDSLEKERGDGKVDISVRGPVPRHGCVMCLRLVIMSRKLVSVLFLGMLISTSFIYVLTAFSYNASALPVFKSNVRVDDTGINTYQQLDPAMVVVDSVIHIAWQDNRNGNYDIYYARSD